MGKPGKKLIIRYKAPVNFAVFLPTPEAIVTDIMYNYVFKGIKFSVNWRTLCIHTTHMYTLLCTGWRVQTSQPNLDGPSL